MTNLGQEYEDCVAVIRSLVLIRKQLTTLWDINAEYKGMEGENIPYKVFGFGTLEDMLRNSGQFNISRQISGQVIISARLSANDEHMAKLVQETRSKKPAPTFKRVYSMPIRRALMSSPQLNWQRTPRPTQFNPQMAYRQSAPTFRPRVQNSVFAAPPRPTPPQMAWTPLPAEKMQRPPMINQRRLDVTVQPQPAKPTEPAPVAPQRKHSPIRAPEPAHSVQTTSGRDLRNVLNQRRSATTVVRDPNRPKFSVKNRLQVSVPAAEPSEKSEDSGVHCSPARSTATPPQKKTFEEKLAGLSITPSSDPLAELAAFCEENGLGTAQFEIYSRKVVGCRLTVNGKTFFEYAPNESAARRQVAQTALYHLKVAQRRTTYPVIKEDNHDLAIRLHDLLLLFPGGVLEKDLPEIFQESTGMSLPDHWTDIVTAYTRFFCLDSGPLAHVVYANELGQGETLEAQEQFTEELPWKDKDWCLFVTHVVSTSMVWARIIGPQHSDKWDQLMALIEEKQGDVANKKHAEQVSEQSMYLIKQESGWCRVRCQEVDNEANRFRAFFLDHGSEEWLPTIDAFVCEQKFQSLPGQALLFRLCGLESMEENPHAKPILERRLEGKAFVAEIRTSADDYVEGIGIRTILFDTSREEDVNMVELLHDEICGAGKAPQLKPMGLTQVVVTHVSDRGDVFCQVPGSGMEYVQKVIDKLTQNEEALALHRGLREHLAAGDTATRYLVLDRANGCWYRAVLKVRHPQTKAHQMFCLDVGCQLRVSEEEMYHLEPLSKALNSYPAMALPCELYDVPKMDMRMASRVKGLLEPQSMALVRVMQTPLAADRVVRVNFYQRLEANKVIVCINETLRMEHEFESSSAV